MNNAFDVETLMRRLTEQLQAENIGMYSLQEWLDALTERRDMFGGEALLLGLTRRLEHVPVTAAVLLDTAGQPRTLFVYEFETPEGRVGTLPDTEKIAVLRALASVLGLTWLVVRVSSDGRFTSTFEVPLISDNQN